MVQSSKKKSRAASVPPKEVPPRSNSRRELVEQDLFGHAIRLFAAQGFAGTSLQDIADAAGLTRPALYHYVSSKDDLLARLMRQSTGDAADRLFEVARDAQLPPADRLRNMVKAHALERLRDPEGFRLLVKSETDLPAEVAEANLRGRRRVLQAFVEVIEAGIQADEFKATNARTAALGVIGMCNWIAWWHHPGAPEADSDIADQFADFTIAGLEQPKRRNTGESDPLRHAVALLREDLGRLERAVDQSGRKKTAPPSGK